MSCEGYSESEEDLPELIADDDGQWPLSKVLSAHQYSAICRNSKVFVVFGGFHGKRQDLLLESRNTSGAHYVLRTDKFRGEYLSRVDAKDLSLLAKTTESTEVRAQRPERGWFTSETQKRNSPHACKKIRRGELTAPRTRRGVYKFAGVSGKKSKTGAVFVFRDVRRLAKKMSRVENVQPTSREDIHALLAKTLTSLEPVLPEPEVLRISEITDRHREEHRRAMCARRRRERIDEAARQYREMAARRPVDPKSRPLKQRPIRRVIRSEAAKMRRRGEAILKIAFPSFRKPEKNKRVGWRHRHLRSRHEYGNGLCLAFGFKKSPPTSLSVALATSTRILRSAKENLPPSPAMSNPLLPANGTAAHPHRALDSDARRGPLLPALSKVKLVARRLVNNAAYRSSFWRAGFLLLCPYSVIARRETSPFKMPICGSTE
ncbi:hypothetical protein R3P38DRAFT_2799475 [Favolaschia claudopus]|uniref:Uncharacterized protein n=1 Tax=Favolaschia claudopus TaxID=2862362 RepID=A0AAV9ZZN8_9AGAR